MRTELYVRADGHAEIGLGHIVRCMALASMLHKHYAITFFCKTIPKLLQDELLNEGFKFSQIQEEHDFFLHLNGNVLVVLDGYHFDVSYQRKVKKSAGKLICIDDLHDREFYADLIINHAPGVVPEEYRAQPFTRFALGLKYVLLRPAFLAAARDTVRASKNAVLFICFGGSDFKNLTLSSLQTASTFKDFEKIIVVTGAAYSYVDTLTPLCHKDNKIKHHHAIDQISMLKLLQEASVALVPASGILLESLSVVPCVITGKYAANQEILYSTLKQAEHIIDGGNFTEVEIKTAITKALQPGEATVRPIDGLSANRIMGLFLSLQTTLRSVTVEDCKQLFDWANDASVRRYAINKQAIRWEDHQQWFLSKIKSETSKIFILEVNSKAIGQIRFDKEGSTWFIDYSIAQEYRGYGLGKTLVVSALAAFSDAATIGAWVSQSNSASIQVFMSLGFSPEGRKKIGEELFNLYFYRV